MRRNKNESERVKKTKQKQTNFERPFTTEITEDMHHSKEYTSLCVVSLYVALHCRHSVPSAGHSSCSSQTVDVTQKKRSIWIPRNYYNYAAPVAFFFLLFFLFIKRYLCSWIIMSLNLSLWRDPETLTEKIHSRVNRVCFVDTFLMQFSVIHVRQVAVMRTTLMQFWLNISIVSSMQPQWRQHMNIICWRHALKRWERAREKSVTFCVLFDSACNVILACFSKTGKRGAWNGILSSCHLELYSIRFGFLLLLSSFFFIQTMSFWRPLSADRKWVQKVINHTRTDVLNCGIDYCVIIAVLLPRRMCDSPTSASDIEDFIPSFVERLTYIVLRYTRNFRLSGYSTFENN